MAAGRGFRTIACWIAGLLVSFALILPLPAGRADDPQVDLALILAIDCSFSVDSREFALQMEGIGQAFMREEVKRAIAQGQRQKIAVAVVQWSDDRNQIVSLPWTIISGPADAEELGRLLTVMPRQLTEGGTSISAALAFSAPLFAAAPSAERQVIDVSTDGRNNSGLPVSPMRDRLVAQGITINGLAIEIAPVTRGNEPLHVHYERNVMGGPGAFVMVAETRRDFARAMRAKMLREIA